MDEIIFKARKALKDYKITSRDMIKGTILDE